MGIACPTIPFHNCNGHSIVKATMSLPRFKGRLMLPPAATTIYCLPSTEYDAGGALTPAPEKNDHRTLPVPESYALNQPSLSPAKRSPPAVASAPPTIGHDVLTCHLILPVL